MVRSVAINVAGQKLSIRTDASEAELVELVNSVNGRVKALQGSTMTVPQAKLYLLAALSLADELRQVRAELARVRQTVEEHAQGALSVLDEPPAS